MNLKTESYRILKEQFLEELQCTLIELEHTPTGAKIMHIDADDPENVFCFSFKTLPTCSDGVAHILEHTVLCGSEKFPVKDPFFSMNRRSLNTFMNAFTGDDFTAYPAASQIKKDFYNLMEVYADAVFHPKLHELSFRQEGHRLDFETEGDINAPLCFKGIVFNEMKGALSSGEARLGEALGKAMFPNVTYGVNSGGDPKDIPQLTYEQLLDFHRTYYHPSRCLFFFYGNLPLQGHLDFLEEHVFQGVEKTTPPPEVELQPRFTKPVHQTLPYAISPEEEGKDQSLVGLSWLTCPIENQLELLALSVLEILLMGTDAAPLKAALLESGLCNQVWAHLEVDTRQAPLTLGFRGCPDKSAEEIEALVNKTLTEIAAKGFDPERIESALHQLELARSEITGDHFPFGLVLYFRAALLAQHGVPAELGLQIHTLFAQLREKLQEPRYLTRLIETHLLQNPHLVRIEMQPDKGLEAREVSEEKERLEKIKNSLTREELHQIMEQAKALDTFQEADEDLELLPKLQLSDVPKENPRYQLDQSDHPLGSIHSHETFTNKLCYLDILFDLPSLSEEQLSYARLMSSFLPQMGWGGKTFEKSLEAIEQHTGGISASLSLNIQASDADTYRPAFQLRGRCLNRKIPHMLPLFQQILGTANFDDKERLRTLIIKLHSGLHSNVMNNPLRFATNQSASQLSRAGAINDAWSGLTFYHTVKKLADNFDEEWPRFLGALQSLQDSLIQADRPNFIVTADQEGHEAFHAHLGLLEGIPSNPSAIWQPSLTPQPVSTHARLIAAPVAFTAKVLKTVPYIHEDAPLLAVASFLLDNKVLHKKIREQGGAYGGGTSPSSLGATFSFFAYRDPNIAATAQAFEEAMHTIIKGGFSDQDLEEAKLEMIQRIDSPISPGSRGITAFGWAFEGRTTEVRQTYRERLLAVTKEEIKRVVEEHLLNRWNEGSLVTFAGKELVDQENKKLKTPLEMRPI